MRFSIYLIKQKLSARHFLCPRLCHRVAVFLPWGSLASWLKNLSVSRGGASLKIFLLIHRRLQWSPSSTGYFLILRMLSILGCFLILRWTEKCILNIVWIRPKKVFRTCRSTIGWTWGLNSKVIYWIYRMVICPVVPYGSVVWWTRVRLGSTEKKLTKVQRNVCIAMTGCIITTPMASLEIL